MRPFYAAIIAALALTGTAFAVNFDPKEVYQESAKSVVLIVASDLGVEHKSMGTGSIIRPDGLIITNAHVIYSDDVSRPYNQINVYLKPRHLTGNLKMDTSNRYNAVLINYSLPLDLAVLKIRQASTPVSFPFLLFSNPDMIEIGEPVAAIGHPEQGGLWTLTTGTISSQVDNFQNINGKSVFQTETSINKGNSGGPLLDKNGLIVGINSNISRKSEDGSAITGINFSIKSSVAVNWLNSIGYPYDFADSREKAVKMEEQKATIVPTPTPPPPQPMAKPPVEEKPAIVSEPRPYKEEDLFKQTENEMENMMQDMKGKLRQKPR